ncbi:deoxyuridine 5'-triphosphate nucleotidohydrolase, mitochondrial precursor, putative [Entamoeba histolytica HM-3:IMSS]|uniref:Deoxyuridine 5'-triphosphate nucleotidohydrolase n=1 Tax=Entamoeba histolytica HM-3:IMSS TaxID=885315 RepID=M7WVB8_ENTHI|nr:deoxyuridine 5'-triphosphate nucleotidohydrolase, mitochondrial precursor, putative [Entamoeba histolytica HM-3:IMSS]
MEEALLVKRLHKDAVIPTRGTNRAAGFDLFCIENVIIQPHDRCSVSTGIAVQIPHNYYGKVAPRSSLAFKYGIDVGAGVIDEDYRGEIKVLLFNHSNDIFRAKKGDRIAQFIIEKISYCEIKEVKELNATIRGEKGFGSTGK